jgi:hypothetical protein
VQAPWAALLVGGAKRVETRDYPPPPQLLRAPVLLLASPPGGLSAAQLAEPAGARARAVGAVVFSHAKRYSSAREWEADAALHCVPAGSAYAYAEGREKWGWVVASVQAEQPAPLALRLLPWQRLHRSVFALPWAAGAPPEE